MRQENGGSYADQDRKNRKSCGQQKHSDTGANEGKWQEKGGGAAERGRYFCRRSALT